MRTETDLVLGLKTFTFKYSVLFSTTLPLTVMGNSDDILLYFDIRHYDMNMPYTCLMSHISIADQWLLSNTKWKSFRIQCILMKDIMWSLPANVLKTFWNTSLHFNISFLSCCFFFCDITGGNRLISHHQVPIHILNHPALFYCSHCSWDKLDPEALFKFSYKRAHIQGSHSLSFSFCLAPVNTRGKAHVISLRTEHLAFGKTQLILNTGTTTTLSEPSSWI